MNFTFFRRSLKENAEFTGRFPKSRKRMVNRKFPKIPLLLKLPVNEGFLAMIFSYHSQLWKSNKGNFAEKKKQQQHVCQRHLT